MKATSLAIPDVLVVEPKVFGDERVVEAHGFLVLSETADFLYKTTDYYAPSHERCLAWDDSSVAIEWPGGTAPALSAKDAQGLGLHEAEAFS